MRGFGKPMPDAANLRRAAEHTITDILTGSLALTHPNKTDAAILLPGLNPTGHNPQMADALTKTAAMTAEALIGTLLTQLDAEFIGTAELTHLRTTAGNAPTRTITVTCPHRELITLAVAPGSDRTRIDCRHLRANLGECETR